MNNLFPSHPGRSSQCVDTPERINFLTRNCSATPRKVNVLGRGGFGIVLKATYRGKRVAVKVVHLKYEHCRKSLENEQHVLGWSHPNIIRIFKVVVDVSHGLVIMERIAGENLQVILNVIHLSILHGIEILTHVASGLFYCHSQGVTHGDLKPQNILVTLADTNRGYVAKLCDFGSSSRANENSRKDDCRGTIRYMAPEILRGAPLAPTADIFSIGVTMWQIEQRKIPYEEIHGNDVIAYRIVREGLRPDTCRGFLNVPEILINGETSSLNSISPRKIKSESLLGRKSTDNIPEKAHKIFPRSITSLLREAKIENHEEFGKNRKIIQWKNIFKYQKWAEDDEIASRYRSFFKLCWHDELSVRPEASQLLRELKDLARKANI